MNMPLSPRELAQKIEKFIGSRVLIIGDVMLDHYQYGTVERISPEAPVPIVRVEHEEFHLGGAANVAKNIKRLGGDPFLIGVCGHDLVYRHLQDLLEKEGIANELSTCSDWQSTVKTRVMAQGQQVVRVDKEVPADMDSDRLDLDSILRTRLAEYALVLISDYGKGMVTKRLLNRVFASPCPQPRVLIDPKIRNFSLYSNAYLLTPNRKEASEAAHLPVADKSEILEAGWTLLRQNRCHNLLITLGSDGMALFCQDGNVWKIPTVARKVYDVTGAGDTVIAVVGAALSSGMDLVQACILANYAAGIVVGQLGAAAITSEELRETLLNEKQSVMIECWHQGQGL
jgi:rfaE bifunctional protein kinase chain/domain